MENEFICNNCKHQCGEYNCNSVCDKNYYEWKIKQEKCIKQLYVDNHSHKEERR